MARRYVVVVGGIAVGKSSLVRTLASALQGAESFLEARSPLIDSFYGDPPRWAFLTQLWYTACFSEQARLIEASGAEIVLQDRSIRDTHEVFTEMRREEGLISGAEFAILATAAESEMSRVAPTDVVLLDASPEVCIDRVQRLGDRLGEAKLSRAELAKLRERYRTWFSQLLTPSKVILETDDLTKSQVVDQVIEALGLCSSSGDKRWRSA